MTTPSIGFNDYYTTHNLRDMGNSYTTLPPLSFLTLVQDNWGRRTPGTGEGDRLDRKVLVPITHCVRDGRPTFFCPPRVKLVVGMPVRAEVVVRQEGEDPYVETFITPEDAANYDFIEVRARTVNVVCYSAEALLENDGQRTGTCDWEIVTLLCSEEGVERMSPLTMARNTLAKSGGTPPSTPYTAQEWAEAVWESSINRGVKVRRPRRT